MRQFGLSKALLPKVRLALFAMAIGIVAAASSAVYAQAAPAEHTKPKSLFAIILDNKDFVFWTIMVLSIIGVTFIIQGFVKNRRSVLLPEDSINHIRELIGQRQFKELIEYTETDPTFVSKALNPALKRAPSFGAMKEAMETAVGEQTADQFRKIEYLNILGNLGPLLGLMGTVLGMIEAFSAMEAAHGSASPGELAGGISKALAHTFLGLFLALPCLASFGILRTIVDKLTVEAALVSEELLLMIKPAEAKPAAGNAVAAARPAGATPQPAGAIPRKAPLPVPPAPAV